jgi:hypothetical protein
LWKAAVSEPEIRLCGKNKTNLSEMEEISTDSWEKQTIPGKATQSVTF